MALTVMQQESGENGFDGLAIKREPDTTSELTVRDQTEVLDFLAERPTHTVFMASLIRDNGMESSLNRGNFFGCRDRDGRLVGDALIGHATLVEARTDASLAALAHVAQNCN